MNLRDILPTGSGAEYFVDCLRQDIADGKIKGKSKIRKKQKACVRLSEEEKERRKMIVRAMMGKYTGQKIAEALDLEHHTSIYYYTEMIKKEDQEREKNGLPLVEVPANWQEIYGIKRMLKEEQKMENISKNQDTIETKNNKLSQIIENLKKIELGDFFKLSDNMRTAVKTLIDGEEEE